MQFIGGGSKSKVWRDSRAHICHKYHKLYLLRKNCHVEKFWENLGYFGKFGEILGNFEKFGNVWEVLPQFTRFHVEKN